MEPSLYVKLFPGTPFISNSREYGVVNRLASYLSPNVSPLLHVYLLTVLGIRNKIL
jgi:hypothetical protein